MDRSKVLARLRSTRFARGDKKKAMYDAKRIAEYLKESYQAKVIGIGSLFESPREFRTTSDVDLLVIDLAADRFLIRRIGEQRGVPL